MSQVQWFLKRRTNKGTEMLCFKFASIIFISNTIIKTHLITMKWRGGRFLPLALSHYFENSLTLCLSRTTIQLCARNIMTAWGHIAIYKKSQLFLRWQVYTKKKTLLWRQRLAPSIGPTWTWKQSLVSEMLF